MPRTRRGRRHVAPLVPVLLVLAMVTGGCAAGNDGTNYVPQGGVDAVGAGGIHLDDVWIDGPHGLLVGQDAGLRLFVANDSGRGDALTGVATSIARRARLVLRGRPVERIRVAPHSDRDLEWHTRRSGVELDDLTRDLRLGQLAEVTFTFARSAPVTMRVTVGPLGREDGANVAAAPAARVPSLIPCGSSSWRTIRRWPTCFDVR